MSVDMVDFFDGFLEPCSEELGGGFSDNEGARKSGMCGDGDEIDFFYLFKSDFLEEADDFFAVQSRSNFG